MNGGQHSADSGQILKIDWAHLHSLSDCDPEFELELLLLLAQDARARIDDLYCAVSDRNENQFQELTHHIKGAAANMGVTGLAAIAQQLEEAPLHDRPRISQMMENLDDIVQALEHLITERQS